MKGPVFYQSGSGREFLAYEYANLVFQWERGRDHVKVSHGTIHGKRTVLWDDVPISGPWCAEVLGRFGQDWVLAQYAWIRRNAWRG
jgi:hypothetical protein